MAGGFERVAKALIRRTPIYRLAQDQIAKRVRGSIPYLELSRRYDELNAAKGRLENRLEQGIAAVQATGGIALGTVLRGTDATIDRQPWRHPFLTAANIARFRRYSDDVVRFAREHWQHRPEPLDCAFLANMAQNMYKWARLAQERGARATLVVNPMDETAVSCPEWEEFDGEHADIFDGAGFRAAHPELEPLVPCWRIAIRPEDNALANAYRRFCEGDRQPLLRLMAGAPGVRHEPLLTYTGFHTYFELARALGRFDVIYAASVPFAAYFSGRPFCAVSVGGDLMWDCGRADDWGRALTLAFNAARFLFVTNPLTLGHSRRLGFANGVYLPYPMDDRRYAPGNGGARARWEQQLGPGVYVLTTARLDEADKGYDDRFVGALARAAARDPRLRFVFLAWGAHAERFRDRMRAAGLGDRALFLPAAGKRRLIDYYRSCDLVLDHLVYGYYGATALEAASIGKPIVMKIREDQYAALYDGDVAPVRNVGGVDEIEAALVAYAGSAELRHRDGAALRAWLVRTHGEDVTVPAMLALLRVAADRVPLPEGLENPLADPLDDGERAYHGSCFMPEASSAG